MGKDWMENESIPQMLEEMHDEICMHICKYNELIEKTQTQEEYEELNKKYCQRCIVRWLKG